MYTLYAFEITDGLIGSGTHGPRSKSTTGSACLVMSFAAPVNKNIKVSCTIKVLAESSLTNLKPSSSYERWWRTSRLGDWLFGLKATKWGSLSGSFRARQAAWAFQRDPTLVPHLEHWPYGSTWHTLVRSLRTYNRLHWTLWFIWFVS